MLNLKHADNRVSLTGLHLKNPCAFPIGWRAQRTTPQCHGSLWAQQKALPRPLTRRAPRLAGTGFTGTGSSADSVPDLVGAG